MFRSNCLNLLRWVNKLACSLSSYQIMNERDKRLLIAKKHVVPLFLRYSKRWYNAMKRVVFLSRYDHFKGKSPFYAVSHGSFCCLYNCSMHFELCFFFGISQGDILFKIWALLFMWRRNRVDTKMLKGHHAPLLNGRKRQKVKNKNRSFSSVLCDTLL